MTMWAAGPGAFESRTAARTPATAIIGSTATTSVAATVVTTAVVAIASATAVRPLETGPRVPANARGIAREILARLGCTGARGAGFTWKQDSVVFDTCGRGRRFASGGLDAVVAGPFVDFWLADSSGV